jgi:hypothetical protein
MLECAPARIQGFRSKASGKVVVPLGFSLQDSGSLRKFEHRSDAWGRNVIHEVEGDFWGLGTNQFAS